MNLLEKLLAIRKAMPYLKKENVNEGQGFNYVSSSQVLQIFRQKADELGVMIIPRITGSTAHKPEGGKQLLTELCVDYEIINVEKPDDKLNIPFYAQGMDVAEKGVGKALTYSEKYLILKLFNIPTDKDDPDAMPATEGSDPASGSPVEDETTRFTKAMNAIRNAFKKRDGNDNAVSMMTRVLGFAKDEDIKAQEDRKKVVTALLEELGVKSIVELG